MNDSHDLYIESEINGKFSKAWVKRMTDYIGSDEKRLGILMNIFLRGNYIHTQKAAWILSECGKNYPSLIIPYFRDFIEKLQEPLTLESVKRNIVRIWQYIAIPNEYIGEVYDICFDFLHTNAATVIKIYSMYVCCSIAKRIPELKVELQLTIEDIVLKNQGGSGAIRSSGKKILKELKKK